ncbi:MAG: hypothetical protein AB8B86_07420 [Pseudomonadales bacterium]
MANASQQDRWAEIERQTEILIEKIAHSEAKELSALLQRRQEELELFFVELDYSPEQLQGIEGKIERLMMRDASLTSLCRQQQNDILNEQKKLNVSKQAIVAYAAESANEEN